MSTDAGEEESILVTQDERGLGGFHLHLFQKREDNGQEQKVFQNQAIREGAIDDRSKYLILIEVLASYNSCCCLLSLPLFRLWWWRLGTREIGLPGG